MKIIKLPESLLLRGKDLKRTILTLAELTKTREKDLGINFAELRNIERGDLMVLYAQIEKSVISNKNRVYRFGSFPTTKKIRKLITTPDMIFHVNKPIPIPAIIASEKEKLLNPKLIDTLVTDLKKIGIKEYYYPFNEFLTELIGNAVEHGIENKNINWWLTHEIDRTNKIAKYTFVDMGLGIVGSHKKAGLPFKYYFLRNNRIVMDALEGKLRSSTKQPNRGRGLPQLWGMFENGFVGNLELLTNNVTLNFKNNTGIAFKNPNFVGTYYSWTIDQNNYQKWKNTR